MASETPAVSIVITAYNVTAYIAEAVESVLAQTFRDYEIILVNDGCPDTENLEAVLQPYFSRIHYIKQPNGGPGAARNAGVLAARAPLIALLDGDDAYTPDYLEYQLAFLRKHPDVVLVYPDTLIVGGPRDGGSTMDYAPSEGEPTFLALLLQTCTVLNPVLMRKDVVFQAGMWDTEAPPTEDFDLWVRIVRCGRIAYHRRQLLRYRIRETSLSAAKERMLRGQLRVYSKVEPLSELEPEDRERVRAKAKDVQAELDLELGWRCIREGDLSGAMARWNAAQAARYRKKPALALWGLRWFSGPALRLLQDYHRRERAAAFEPPRQN